MDIFEQIVEYRKNLENCATLFSQLAAMNTQREAIYSMLIPMLEKTRNVPMLPDDQKKLYVSGLREATEVLGIQKQIDATASAAYTHTALELKRLAKQLEVAE